MVATLIIAIHQIFFQGMFVVRNVTLQRRLGAPIRGKNREATVSIVFFALFIVGALATSLLTSPLGQVAWLG